MTRPISELREELKRLMPDCDCEACAPEAARVDDLHSALDELEQLRAERVLVPAVVEFDSVETSELRERLSQAEAQVATLTRERDEARAQVEALTSSCERLMRERDEARDRLNARGMSCTPDQDFIRLSRERDSLRKALEVISQGRGPFSQDQLTFATNTIESMKSVANAALSDTEGGT